MTAPSLTFTKRWKHRLSDYVTAIAWSTDGSLLAATSSAGEVVLFPEAQGKEQSPVVLQTATGDAISSLGFSADGQYLAAAGQGGDVVVWVLQRSEKGYAVALRQSHSGVWIDQLAWHPARPQLAYGVGSHVKIWDSAATETLDFQASSVLHLSWRPQGDRLAVSGHGGVKVWNAADWSATPKLIAVPGASLYAAWSSDGRYLGSGNLDRTLTVMAWDSPPPWLMQGFPGKVRQVAWSETVSASGTPLLAAACVEGITLWRQGDDDKGSWRSQVLQHHTDRVNGIAFQPETSRLASAGADGTVCLWETKKAPAALLKIPEGGCSALAWHPGGALVAIAGTTGGIGVWGLEERKSKGFG